MQNQNQWTYKRFVQIIIIIIFFQLLLLLLLLFVIFYNIIIFICYYFLIIIELISVKLSVTIVNAHICEWLTGEHHILLVYISNFT